MTPDWTIDVHTADHDAVKTGVLTQRVSRVLVSAREFPDPLDAEELAAQIAVAVHGGMPTRASHCL